MSIYDGGGCACRYLDDSLVVVDKPAGLPSVPGRAAGLQDCAHSRVRQAWPDALVVHRLDMATSGLLLFARGIDAQRRLGRAFAERRVAKHYVALVDGELAGEAGTIDLPLRADWPNRPRQIVDPVAGKSAVTHWRCIERERPAGRSRVELQPVTGRSHQLRVHLQAIGHPIVGDTLYGPEGMALAARLMLHACGLAFDHPHSGQRVELSSPAPF